MGITRCEFEKVYRKYSPSKLEKFYFKYFSTNTDRKDLWVKQILIGILLIPFILGFVFSINDSVQSLAICTYVFSGILLIFGLTWIYVWIANKIRIKKIQKQLRITRYEYDKLIDQFYFDSSINAFIKNKIGM